MPLEFPLRHDVRAMEGCEAPGRLDTLNSLGAWTLLNTIEAVHWHMLGRGLKSAVQATHKLLQSHDAQQMSRPHAYRGAEPFRRVRRSPKRTPSDQTSTAHRPTQNLDRWSVRMLAHASHEPATQGRTLSVPRPSISTRTRQLRLPLLLGPSPPPRHCHRQTRPRRRRRRCRRRRGRWRAAATRPRHPGAAAPRRGSAAAPRAA